MQIRLTVIGPRPESPAGRAASDVLVTAPAGTALAAVAPGLAGAVGGGDGPVVLYAGRDRLDVQRSTLGEPPLTDGAVLSLGGPAEPGPAPAEGAAQLRVVAGPDAGGVHLLHGGQIRVGRSAQADVPLDDPDVSRLHCAVTVAPDGRVTVTDLGSTNGTTVGTTPVTDRPVPLPPGAPLRLGESTLRLTTGTGTADGPLRTAPDGEGHIRVRISGAAAHDDTEGSVRRGPVPHGAPGSGGAGEPPHAARDREAGPWTAGHRSARSGTGGTGPGGAVPRVVDAGTHPDARAEVVTANGTHPKAGGHGAASSSARPVRPNSAETTGPPGPDPDVSSHHGGGHRAPQTAAHDPGATPAGGTRHGYGPHTPGAHGYGPAGWGAAGGAVAPEAPATAREHGGPGGPSGVPLPPGQAGAPGPAGPPHPSGTEDAWPEAPATAGDPTGAREPRTTRTDVSEAAIPYADPSVVGHPHTGTPSRGTPVPRTLRKRGGLSAWARRLAGTRDDAAATDRPDHTGAHVPYADPPHTTPGAPHLPEQAAQTWPDLAYLLLTALGPGSRLWERGPEHPELLTVRLGTADRTAPDGASPVAVPVTVSLRQAGALGLAGPGERQAGLARAVLAQLAALHSPDTMDIVLISTDRSRPVRERTAEWAWLGWLPHLRPAHGQECRLLLAYSTDQAALRTGELLRRVENTPRHTENAHHGGQSLAPTAHGHPPDGPCPAPPQPAQATRSGPRQDAWAGPDHLAAGTERTGPYTVLVVDGDPGSAELRAAVEWIAVHGPAAGVHVLCLAETPPVPAAAPLQTAYQAACAAVPALRMCGAVGLLTGDVATTLQVVRTAGGGLAGPGTVGVVDAVSAAWAERFARALAPLRPEGGAAARTGLAAPLPRSARLLDELGLARATPASLLARWAAAGDDPDGLGGRAWAVLGAGPRGPVGVDLAVEGPHLLLEGPAGSGRTELLRAMAASLAAAERPDRLAMVLMDGRDGTGTHGSGAVGGATGTSGDGLRICLDLPHVTTHLTANDPVLMREFAQSLAAELKRRAELLGRMDFVQWHAERGSPERPAGAANTSDPAPAPDVTPDARSGRPRTGDGPRDASPGAQHQTGGRSADLDAPPSTTMRLRPGSRQSRPDPGPPLPRLVVVVDDVDALLAPPLGAPGRPAAGSVVRALEAVARDGARLGVHLLVSAASGGRAAESELARCAALRVTLDTPAAGPDDPAPGRGRLRGADGRGAVFQGGRVTGRIPRTATLRPTVVPLEWERMGDPPARRSVRELGNGPTDLALLASAVERAARSVSAATVASLL